MYLAQASEEIYKQSAVEQIYKFRILFQSDSVHECQQSQSNHRGVQCVQSEDSCTMETPARGLNGTRSGANSSILDVCAQGSPQPALNVMLCNSLLPLSAQAESVSAESCEQRAACGGVRAEKPQGSPGMDLTEFDMGLGIEEDDFMRDLISTASNPTPAEGESDIDWSML